MGKKLLAPICSSTPHMKKTGFSGLRIHAVDDLAAVMAVFADL